MKRRWLLGGLLAATASASALALTQNRYTTVTVDPSRDHLSFHWKNAGGQRIGSLGRLAAEVARENRRLVFATNAGIFDTDFAPRGLFIADGTILRPLNTGMGGGNFYMPPNGVFYVDDGGGHIVRTQDFRQTPETLVATQSGPMLVEHGAINAQFSRTSHNRLLRSGVGITRDGKIVFTISKGDVTFYEFASYFRDHLNCDDALFLDGVISHMYAPAQGRKDTDGDFAGMIAVTRTR